MGLLMNNSKDIEKLYTDTFSIYRPVTKDDGYGGTVEEEVLISENNKCRLSKATIKSSSNTSINSSEQEFRLFIPLKTEVLQNDRLEVHRGSSKYIARASFPFKYYDVIPHQEIVLKEVIENVD
mgnify:CR=1 FL=1|nr:MAG TPA: hypothetical protein [Caudoviricetes sp.]